MAIIDATYLIGSSRIFEVDEDPSIVSIDANAGDLIYYVVGEGLPKILYYKTTDGDNTSVQRLVSRNTFDATADPTDATANALFGYSEGSKWYNTTNGALFICVGTTPTTGTWVQVG